MAAIVNIPFNFMPSSSTSRKTSSYTVPAGKYARAVLSFYAPRTLSFATGGGTVSLQYITIDGVSVLPERSVGTYVSIGANNSYTITLSPAGFVSGYFNSIQNLNGVTVSMSGVQTRVYCSSMSSSTPSGSSSNIHFISEWDAPPFLEVWLTAGQVISATGGNWQAVVTEYTQIS